MILGPRRFPLFLGVALEKRNVQPCQLAKGLVERVVIANMIRDDVLQLFLKLLRENLAWSSVLARHRLAGNDQGGVIILLQMAPLSLDVRLAQLQGFTRRIPPEKLTRLPLLRVLILLPVPMNSSCSIKFTQAHTHTLLTSSLVIPRLFVQQRRAPSSMAIDVSTTVRTTDFWKGYS